MFHRVNLIGAPLLLAACVTSSTSSNPAADGGPQLLPDGGASEGGALDSGGGGGDGAVASACTPPTGAGTTHASSITADTTWSAADSPHVVTTDITIAQGATLTIAPCAVVRMQASTSFTVKGKLAAPGAASTPIVIEADDAQKPWTCIQTSGGTIDFASVTLKNGGNTSNPFCPAPLQIRGDGTTPVQALLRAVDVTVDGSAQLGIVLMAGGAFSADSSNVTVRGAAGRPISTSVGAAGSIPTGQYTGNALDEILLIADQPLSQDTTYHDRGVPYRLGDEKGNGTELRVGTSGSATTQPQRAVLTLDTGVTLRVSPGGRIIMNTPGDSSTPANGALVANGTQAKPVVLTSAAASPAAGDWMGLMFSGVPDAADKIDWTHIEYAGGPSQAKSFHCSPTGTLDEAEDAAVMILGGPPGAAFVTNSTFKASAGYGVDRGWSGTAVDFTPTNTFVQMARCSQSTPRNTNGSCPASAPCN